MKRYFLQCSGAALLLSLMAMSVLAQEDNAPLKKGAQSELIIIKTKDGKNTKLTIEMKDGEVKVNGKPLSAFKDDNVTITQKKELNELLTLNGLSRSKFRTSGWGYGGEDMAGAVDKPFLGVTTEKENDGAAISSISDESAAQKAGLKEGDVITGINDQKINSPEDLSDAISKYKPGEKITIVFNRDGKEQSQSVALGKRKESTFTFSSDMKNFDFSPYQQGNYWGGNRAKLGIKAQETEDGKGVKVLHVDDDSPADKAGIQEDDIITAFDGTEVNDVDTLRKKAAEAASKPSFKVKLIRDGNPEEIEIKIPKNLKTANL